MSMTVGVVTINQTTEAVAGIGMARALYDAEVAIYATLLASVPLTPPSLGSTSAPYSAARPATATDVALIKTSRLALLNGVRDRANAYASAIVTYIQAAATVTGPSIT